MRAHGLTRLLVSLGLAAAFARSAWANDSAAEYGMGGLVMVKTVAITMQREDLTITPAWITVRYEFRNDGTEPVTLRVAFPLPDVPSENPGGMWIGKTKVGLGPFLPPNFVNFWVSADGNYIEPKIEVRAELPGGQNITRELREIGGGRLILQPRMIVNSGDAGVYFDDVGPNQFRQWLELGAIEASEPLNRIMHDGDWARSGELSAGRVSQVFCGPALGSLG